jgi:site-specific DNA-methyltransferase (adenine-specific)
LVFDPFGGGFTTGVACIKTNRNFIGCELVKEYYDNLGKPRFIKHLTNEYKIIEDKLLGKNETE